MSQEEKLQARIQELEEENDHLKSKLTLLGAGVKNSMFSIPQSPEWKRVCYSRHPTQVMWATLPSMILPNINV